ncbi:cytochrome P460 family protein [Pseudomonas sp. MAP12]|uniref:Cytochrome P460 family protein n=1 Tax=Geopseudomonas aromaticivorans TaxID=2849492 RepID=A0ABS6MVT7_9GAMM|nr:cytochrome P460 family protein [Pseudomonas aromaticivorans]MBV2132865.1 cytochrome P460 family protein [Pseudomonas aromaticivorans]
MKPLLLALLAVLPASAVLAADPEVPYPTGYRYWHHVKSMVIEQGHPQFDGFGGIHHIYANASALEGYKAGTFPDGSVLVFDRLEAKRADNAVTEGARKDVAVMLKDAKKFAATGGWGFEAFGGGDPTRPVVGADAASTCYACHAPEKAHDYVFSRTRD